MLFCLDDPQSEALARETFNIWEETSDQEVALSKHFQGKKKEAVHYSLDWKILLPELYYLICLPEINTLKDSKYILKKTYIC